MAEMTQEELKKHVRVYIAVFATLAALTIVTVAISYLHLSVPYAIGVALIVATLKGSLVACYFMHLISERSTLYLILAFTALCFIGLLLFPMFTTYEWRP